MAVWYQWEGQDLILNLRVQPRARRDQFGEVLGEARKVRITAPPVDGKANAHLIRFLADSCGVPQTRVILLAGAQHRAKRLRIDAPKQLPDGVARP